MREVILKSVPLLGSPAGGAAGETLLMSKSISSHHSGMVFAVPSSGIFYASGTILRRTRIMDDNHEESGSGCLCYVDMISSHEVITFSLHGVVKIFSIDESNEVCLHLVLVQTGLKTNVTAVKAFRFMHDDVLLLLVGDVLGLTLYRLEPNQKSFREMVFLRMDAPVYSIDVAVASGDIFMVGLKSGSVLMFHVALTVLVSGALRIRPSSKIPPSPMVFPPLTASTTTINYKDTRATTVTNIFSTLKHLHSTLNGQNKDQIVLHHPGKGVTAGQWLASSSSWKPTNRGVHHHVSWMVESQGLGDDCRERSGSHLSNAGLFENNHLCLDPSFEASSTFSINKNRGDGFGEEGGGNDVLSHESSEEMSSRCSIASTTTTPSRLIDDDDMGSIAVRDGLPLAIAPPTISISLPLASEVKPIAEAILDIEESQQKSVIGLSPSHDDVFMPLRDHRISSMSRQTRSQSLDDVNLQGLSPGQGLAAASESLEKSSPKTPNNLDTVRSRMMSLISSVVPGSKEKEVDAVTGGALDQGELEKEKSMLGSIPLLLQIPSSSASSSSSQAAPSSLDHVFGMPIPYYHTHTRTMEMSVSDVPLHGCCPRSMASGPALVAMSPLSPTPTVSTPSTISTPKSTTNSNSNTVHDGFNSNVSIDQSKPTSAPVVVPVPNREESVYGSFVIAWLDGRLCTGMVTAILERGLGTREEPNEGQGKGMSTSRERDDDDDIMVLPSLQPSIQPSIIRRNTITFQWHVHRSICIGEAFCQVQFLPQLVSFSKTTDIGGSDQGLSTSSSSGSPLSPRDLCCCVVSTWTGTMLFVSVDDNELLTPATTNMHPSNEGITNFEDGLTEPQYVLSFDTRLFLVPHSITIARQFSCQQNTLYLFNEVGECFVVSDIHQQLSTIIPHELPAVTFQRETIEGIKKLLNIMRYADEKDVVNLPDSMRCVLRHAIDRYAAAGMGKEGWKERQGKELRYVLNYLNSKA